MPGLIGSRDLTVHPDLPRNHQESFRKFSESFDTEYLSTRKFQPTQKQLTFVDHYLKTGSAEEAYTLAGYYPLEKQLPHMRRLVWWRVLHSKNVQILLRMAMWQWAQKYEISPSAVANRLLHIADVAEDLQTRVSALRELNCMLGYHKDMGQKNDIPCRKKKHIKKKAA